MNSAVLPAQVPIAVGAPGVRLAIIDGLRGVAAMLVVLFHLSDAAHLREVPVVGYLMAHGNFGVEVFFVISGFVITYSVRNALHTLPFLGRFALRRSVRLDPPYWLTILCEILLLNFGLMLFPDHVVPIPSATDVLAHLVYLQGLLGYPQIIPIFWTLCYEVQFYLALVGSLVCIRSCCNRFPGLNKRVLLFALGWLTFTASLAIDVDWLPYPHAGLFVDRWYQFCLGIGTLAVVVGWMRPIWIVVAWSVMALTLAVSDATQYTVQSALFCLATSVVIVLSKYVPALTRTASSAPLQFLGRISYSLYLLHAVVGWRFVSVSLRLLPPDQPTAVRFLVFFAGIFVSIGVSYLMYRIVERPSLALAARISTQTRQAG